MKKASLAAFLMILSIALIVLFQAYWLRQMYKDERRALRREADIVLRETMINLQMRHFLNDSFSNKFRHIADSSLNNATNRVTIFNTTTATEKGQSTTLLRRKSNPGSPISITLEMDSGRVPKGRGREMFINPMRRNKHDDGNEASMIIKFPVPGDSPNLAEIDSSFSAGLKKSNIDLSYSLKRGTPDTTGFGTGESAMAGSKIVLAEGIDLGPSMNKNAMDTGLGIARENASGPRMRTTKNGMFMPATTIEVELLNPGFYLFKKIALPLLFSFLMIAITTAAFIFLYKNLKAQHRLAAIKNDFIGNITHELKTPIATVGVALEALKNFNAINNPERTKEYLDISTKELNRLSLLVDKVLRLSLFEQQQLDVRLVPTDIKQVAEAVLESMQFQFEKVEAKVKVAYDGTNFMLPADKYHLSSVLFNLLDNALKYSAGKPDISLHITQYPEQHTIVVADRGIGIPAEYRSRIFEKFFRVPHGNTHNVKGYGLGLSYVAEVVRGHKGSIVASSNGSEGTVFTITFNRAV